MFAGVVVECGNRFKMQERQKIIDIDNNFNSIIEINIKKYIFDVKGVKNLIIW